MGERKMTQDLSFMGNGFVLLFVGLVHLVVGVEPSVFGLIGGGLAVMILGFVLGEHKQ